MTLSGRNAIVTGSTSGIGAGLADALAAAGAAVTLNGFGDADEIERARAAMAERHGVPVRYSGADMSDAAQVRGMVEEAEAALGPVHILVNNAGIQHTAPIEAFPIDRWDAIIAINLSAVFHATAAALPGMRRAGFGRVVNVASVHGLVASAEKAAYVTAKHGVVGLTKVTALETAREPITCNAICPGWVLTPLVERQIKDRAAQSGRDFDGEAELLLAEKQPSRRFVTPAQLGAMLVFLCSDATSELTGQALPMDGGWTAQ